MKDKFQLVSKTSIKYIASNIIFIVFIALAPMVIKYGIEESLIIRYGADICVNIIILIWGIDILLIIFIIFWAFKTAPGIIFFENHLEVKYLWKQYSYDWSQIIILLFDQKRKIVVKTYLREIKKEEIYLKLAFNDGRTLFIYKGAYKNFDEIYSFLISYLEKNKSELPLLN